MELIVQYVAMAICFINKNVYRPVLEVPMLIMCLECVWIVPKDVSIALVIHNVSLVLMDSISIAHLASAFLAIQYA